jgi:hypothetical protein
MWLVFNASSAHAASMAPPLFVVAAPAASKQGSMINDGVLDGYSGTSHVTV